MKRRDFLKKIGTASAVVIAAPVAVMAAKLPQQPKSGLLSGEIGRYESVRFAQHPMLEHAEYTDIEEYIRKSLGKHMQERMDEICFEKMYFGTGVT